MQQRDAADGAATEMFDRHMVGLCPAVRKMVAGQRSHWRPVPLSHVLCKALRAKFKARKPKYRRARDVNAAYLAGSAMRALPGHP